VHARRGHPDGRVGAASRVEGPDLGFDQVRVDLVEPVVSRIWTSRYCGATPTAQFQFTTGVTSPMGAVGGLPFPDAWNSGAPGPDEG
jgi:hypothetical protein